LTEERGSALDKDEEKVRKTSAPKTGAAGPKAETPPAKKPAAGAAQAEEAARAAEQKAPEKAPRKGRAPAEGKKPAEGQEPPAGKTPPGKSREDLQKELDGLRKKLDAAQRELEHQKDLLLRTAAEYDNYRKRTAKEKQSAYADATSEAVQAFLPVEDNLERALAQKECSAQDLRKGVEMVQKQMRAALGKLGVTEMGKEGEPFDPAVHSAIAHVEDKGSGENTVTKVFQKGYKIGDKVVRHAMVQVAN